MLLSNAHNSKQKNRMHTVEEKEKLKENAQTPRSGIDANVSLTVRRDVTARQVAGVTVLTGLSVLLI